MDSVIFEHKYNICLVGNTYIGKTSFIKRLIEDRFVNTYKKTTGIETYNINKKIKNKNFLFKIWDLSGNTKPDHISNDLFRTVDGFIYAFAVNDQESFDDVKEWIDSTVAKKIPLENCLMISLKSELPEDEFKVNLEEVMRMCTDYELEFFDTSSKTNKNIKESFDRIIDKIFMKNSSSSDFSMLSNNKNNTESALSCQIF